MTAFNFNDPPNRRREAAEVEARKLVEHRLQQSRAAAQARDAAAARVAREHHKFAEHYAPVEHRAAEARERDLLTRAAAYARSIAVLRQRAAADNRDTYTVALGQLARFGLIEDDLYDELIALPRIER